MVALPQLRDLTLEACDRAYEDRYNRDRRDRPYLGMSAIGGECPRQLWYRFRWVARERFDARSIKRFADGHLTEEVVIDRLTENSALTVQAVDPATGDQFGFTDLAGHVRGHMDGKILGLIEAPKTWHVLEVKAVGEDSFKKLARIIDKVGEKAALKEWNPTYYGQAQLYMFYGEFTRHYTVVASPGGRAWTSIRTNFDKADAATLVEKAKSIVFAERPPERIATAADFYLCRFCPFAEACWTDPAKAQRNCRTCANVTPWKDGTWRCAIRPGERLSEDRQREGCRQQVFHPLMLWDREPDGMEHDPALARDNITYRLADGGQWIDRGAEA